MSYLPTSFVIDNVLYNTYACLYSLRISMQNSVHYQLIVAVSMAGGGRAAKKQSQPPGPESKTSTFEDVSEEDGPCKLDFWTLNI